MKDFASLSLSGVKSFDPAQGNLQPTSISIRNGKFIKTSNDVAITVPEGNYVLTPGLTDLHTHLFKGQDLGISPERDLLSAGVVRAIDAGSAGGHLFEAFRNLIIESSSIEIKAFLNIASIGTTSLYLQGELMTPAYSNVDLAVNTIRDHADLLVGVKVRASKDAGGDFVGVALQKARRAADLAEVPLMVHLGPAPVSVDEILRNLGAGDILTHCYTGWAGNSLVEDGKPKSVAVAAVKRGVLFDVGHGMGGFDSTVASIMIAEGYLPDSISTDLHSGSISKVISLPNVMSKFLALGMTLDQVIYRTTFAPQSIGGFRTLKGSQYPLGELATLALFKIEEGEFEFEDVHGHVFFGKEMITPMLVINNGREWISISK